MAKSSSNNGSGELMSSKISQKLDVSTYAETPINDEARSNAIIAEIKELQGEVSVDSESNVAYTNITSTREYISTSVSLRSLFDGRLEYTGQVSGKQYVWDKAGSTVEVQEDDAVLLLAKRVGKQPCCGDSKDGTAIFSKLN